jgi:hypothetical protein
VPGLAGAALRGVGLVLGVAGAMAYELIVPLLLIVPWLAWTAARRNGRAISLLPIGPKQSDRKLLAPQHWE